jgi:hypothetical protein
MIGRQPEINFCMQSKPRLLILKKPVSDILLIIGVC